MFVRNKKLQKTHFDFALSCFATFCNKIVKERAPFGRFIAKQTNLLFFSGKSEKETLKMLIPTTKLNNDVEMPIIGFGTWRVSVDIYNIMQKKIILIFEKLLKTCKRALLTNMHRFLCIYKCMKLLRSFCMWH